MWTDEQVYMVAFKQPRGCNGPMGSVNTSCSFIWPPFFSEIAPGTSALNVGNEWQFRYVTWVTYIVYLNNCNPLSLGMKPNWQIFQSRMRLSGTHRYFWGHFRSLGSCSLPWTDCSQVWLLILQKLLFHLCGTRARYEIFFPQTSPHHHLSPPHPPLGKKKRDEDSNFKLNFLM